MINCIFCKTDSGNIFLQENGFVSKKCPFCNLIYISPRPTQEKIIDLYGHDNAYVSAQDHLGGEFSKRLAAKHVLKIILKHKARGTLLEIGSGAGFFLDEAKKIGFKPHGIEPNIRLKNFIETGLKIPCESSFFSQKSFNKKAKKGVAFHECSTFDLIYHCDVISHFHDPIKEFRTMHKKLNNDGILVFETGNLGDIDKKYFDYIEKLQYPDHLFFFSEKNLNMLLKKTGFQLVKIERYSILPQLKFLLILKKIFRNKGTTFHEVTTFHEGKTKKISLSKNSLTNIASNSQKTSFLKRVYHYTHHLLRYKAGRIVPKKNRPQTLIVVAKKRTS